MAMNMNTNSELYEKTLTFSAYYIQLQCDHKYPSITPIGTLIGFSCEKLIVCDHLSWNVPKITSGITYSDKTQKKFLKINPLTAIVAYLLH